jgi:hypothetical protein
MLNNLRRQDAVSYGGRTLGGTVHGIITGPERDGASAHTC